MSDLFLTPQQYAEWYARERATVIEECARVVERLSDEWSSQLPDYRPADGFEAAQDIAAAIRALATPQSLKGEE